MSEVSGVETPAAGFSPLSSGQNPEKVIGSLKSEVRPYLVS